MRCTRSVLKFWEVFSFLVWLRLQKFFKQGPLLRIFKLRTTRDDLDFACTVYPTCIVNRELNVNIHKHTEWLTDFVASWRKFADVRHQKVCRSRHTDNIKYLVVGLDDVVAYVNFLDFVDTSDKVGYCSKTSFQNR